MKTLKIFLTLVVVALISSCSSSKLAGPGVYEDDIYFNPKKVRSEQPQFTEVPVLDKEAQKTYRREFNQKVQEYEQSDRAHTQEDLRDFTEIQREYAGILSNDSLAEVDTMLYYNDETGYWVDGFEGSDMDRDYAERIVRFHGPFRGIPWWSPLYTDLVYGSNWGWNVYVDGNYAYAFPSWYNSFYYPYYYSPGWSFSMNWGWNSWGYDYPYYGGWRYGYYSPWYSWGYNPWHHPYYHHDGWHHHNNYYSNYSYGPRHSSSSYSGMSNSYSGEPQSTMRPNRRVADANNAEVKSTRDTGVTGRPVRSSSYSNTPGSQSPNRSGQPMVNRRSGQGETKSGSDQSTRSSYQPRYSPSSTPVRPQYNSQSTTRPAGGTPNNGSQGTSGPRREYSKPSTGNNGSYSRPSSPTPNRGSSSGVTTAPSRPTQSSGSYTPSRSSGSSESYTPSRSSGNSHSSSSSSSSSSGSSGSSGSSNRSSGSPRR